MATLLSSASAAMAAWPKSLRHPQTCTPDCGSGKELAIDGMAAPPNNDVLAGQFEEMLEYDQLVGLMEDVNTALTEAAVKLEPLTEHLGRACNQKGCGERSKLQRLATQLDGLALSLKQATPRLEGVHQLIQQSRFHSARARCEFTIRERARARHLLCEEQVAALTQRDGAGARQNFSRDEKQARLSARDAACVEFTHCTERAEKIAGVVLGRKPATVEAMVTGLCHFMAAYSAGANALSQELGDTSDSMQQDQRPRNIVVMAERQKVPPSVTARLLPSMPVCDFGCGLLAGLTPWGFDTGCCQRDWQYDGSPAGADALYGSSNPTTPTEPSKARLPFTLPFIRTAGV